MDEERSLEMKKFQSLCHTESKESDLMIPRGAVKALKSSALT